MDSVAIHRQAVKEVILKYGQLRPSHGEIRLDPIFDDTANRYALLQVGWDRGRRVRGLLLYIVLDGDNAIVEYDGMEHGIVDDLIAGGVAKDQVCLAYMRESVV